MSDTMKIGTSTFGGNYEKKAYYFLKSNENNLFRVLPPLFSLADKGQFAKYYATHKIWLQEASVAGSSERGKSSVYQFFCLEKIDQKSKLIQVHCPYCDMERKNKAVYEDAKLRGASKDQLEEFRLKHVAPFEKEKKFYLNVVSLENKVGLLPLGSKAFQALQDRLKDIKMNYGGIDATGVNGLFLNFKKTQKFKGDRDTVYSVDPAMDNSMVNGIPQMQLKPHVLTTDFIEIMRTTARDLGALFQGITAEEMNQVIQTAPENKKTLLDKLFGRGEKSGATTGHNVGSTGVETVTRIEFKNGDISLHAPDPFQAPAAVNPANAPAMVNILVNSASTPVATVAVPVPAPFNLQPADVSPGQPAFPVNPMQPGAPQVKTTMSDEEFIRTFGA